LKLDFELELGVWIGAGNALGEPIPIGRAGEHIAGLCLLNDWSARDIQRWESTPLGPFLSKNFGSTISPWVITLEALAPFRIRTRPPRPAGDPKPLDYLWDDEDQRSGAFDIELEVLIASESMRAKGMPAKRVSVSNTRHLYWTTLAQMVAHHTWRLQSGAWRYLRQRYGVSAGSYGYGHRRAFVRRRETVRDRPGEKRSFLENGDELSLRAHAKRAGFVSIGFGDCSGRIV
jgi:fumarylacetoacetase